MRWTLGLGTSAVSGAGIRERCVDDCQTGRPLAAHFCKNAVVTAAALFPAS